jgi:pyruvate/2-oxoglutarate dehydrogenase complex dihydrolipoamide acyltransferase (E2) component
MGEGIRSAKVVALLKKPGDPIALDDALCEVETDKAVYPIESSFAGTMGEWKTKIDDTVEIGQELGTILAEGAEIEEQFETATELSARETTPAMPAAETKAVTAREPALSATITRKLDRRPGQFTDRRALGRDPQSTGSGKKSNGKNAPSPSVMLALGSR